VHGCGSDALLSGSITVTLTVGTQTVTVKVPVDLG
jgi:hypothetical protein